MRKGRWWVPAALLAVATLVAARIWWVNTSLPQIPLEYHGQGDWVSLEGTFHNSSEEGTEGYSVMVEGAALMTYDEYLDTYGEGPREPGAHGSAHCVVEVTLRIRNDGSEAGGLNAFEMILVPDRADEYLICDVMNDDALWPQAQVGAGRMASVRPGTEYVAHVPYVFNGMEETYLREVTDTRFTLLVSRMPERKMIEVRLPTDA